MNINLSISDDIDVITKLLKDAPNKTQRAINRTLKKVSRFVERRVYSEVASDKAITQKILKSLGRVKVTFNKALGTEADFSLVIWIGTYDIPAHKLGKAVQNKKGVKVGKHLWEGAFLMQPVNVPKELVFKRKYNWAHKFQRSKKSGRMMYMGLPLEKQGLPIFDSADRAVKKIIPDILERFSTVLHQEINYAFNIES